MKARIWLTTALLLAGGLAPLFPCDVTMETSRAAGEKDKIQVRLLVECIHRRCPVKIEATRLEADGLVIEKQGQWQRAEDGVYRMDLVVSLQGSERGEIRVLRSCPKRGLQKETLEIARR